MAKKKASGWKGGSFRAAVGMYIKKKAKKSASKVKKYLVKGAKESVGIKRKKGKK